VSPIPLKMEVRERPKSVSIPSSPKSEPDQRLDDLLQAITLLGAPPSVVVQPPDLSDIVTAVTSLKPGPTAAEIAAAIADVLQPRVGEDSGAPLQEVAEALRTLDFRLQGMGRQAYGGGSVSLTASDIAAISGLTDTQLRASPVPVSGPITDSQLRASAVQVKDDYQAGEILVDQSGAGGVLTYTFSNQQSLIVVHSVGTLLTSRADPFGGTPSSTLGIRCDDGVPVYIPVQTSAVKVFAPSGTTVTVYGVRRT